MEYIETMGGRYVIVLKPCGGSGRYAKGFWAQFGEIINGHLRPVKWAKPFTTRAAALKYAEREVRKLYKNN